MVEKFHKFSHCVNVGREVVVFVFKSTWMATMMLLPRVRTYEIQIVKHFRQIVAKTQKIALLKGMHFIYLKDSFESALIKLHFVVFKFLPFDTKNCTKRQFQEKISSNRFKRTEIRSLSGRQQVPLCSADDADFKFESHTYRRLSYPKKVTRHCVSFKAQALRSTLVCEVGPENLKKNLLASCVFALKTSLGLRGTNFFVKLDFQCI